MMSGELERAEVVLEQYRRGIPVSNGLASNTIQELATLVRRDRDQLYGVVLETLRGIRPMARDKWMVRAAIAIVDAVLQ